jgi:hypothetical protein
MHVSLSDLADAIATLPDADSRAVATNVARSAVKADGMRRLAARMTQAETILRGNGGRFSRPDGPPIAIDRNGRVDA